ncbi:unnamed protein product [Pedinophyceae sp. YPF-701]|nr:unnamed protein product [Pedinophyceae sp. YPF-701]
MASPAVLSATPVGGGTRVFEYPPRDLDIQDWSTIDAIDLSSFYTPEGVDQGKLAELDSAVRLLVQNAVGPAPGEDADASVARLTRACVVLQLGLELQSMRYDDVLQEVDEKDAELEDYRAEVSALQARLDARYDEQAELAAGRGVGAMEAEDLRIQVSQLSTALQSAEQRGDELQDRNVALEDRARDLQKELDAVRTNADALDRRLRLAEDEVRMLRMQADADARSRGHNRLMAGGLEEELEVRKREVRKLLRDNGDLDAQCRELRRREAELKGELEETSQALVALSDSEKRWRAREADLALQAEEARDRATALAAENDDVKQTVMQQLRAMEAMQATFDRNYKIWEEERAALDAQCQALQDRIDRVARAPTQDGAERSDLDDSEVGSTHGAGRLREELLKAQERELLLMEAYEDLERNVGREVDAALAEERERTRDDRLSGKVAEDELRRARDRIQHLLADLERLHNDVEYHAEKNKQYERGYGLQDAVLELKAWRDDALQRERTIKDLGASLNEVGDKFEQLLEENRALRERAGLPESAAVPLAGVRLPWREEAAQLKQLVAHLELELQGRADEEMRLRQELRYRVKWSGSNAVRLGLSEAQVAYVEEVIEGLKGGGYGDTPEQRALQRMEERLTAMQRRLEALHRVSAMPEEERARLLQALAESGPTQGGLMMPVYQIAQGPPAVSLAELRRLEESLRSVVEQLGEVLERAGAQGGGLLRVVEEALATVRGAVGRAQAAGDAAAAGGTPGAALGTPGVPTPGMLNTPGGVSRVPPGSGAEYLRNLFQAKATELAQMQAELAERAGVEEAMRRERDALRARLRGEGRGGADGTFVSIQELQEAQAEIQALQTQLVEALETSSVRERESAALEDELSAAHAALQQARDQTALLYREFARVRAAHIATERALNDRLETATTERDAAQRAEQEVQRVVRVLSGAEGAEEGESDEARMKRALVEATRRMALSQARLARVGRQVTLVEAREAAKSREVGELKGELTEMGAVLRARVDQLERARAEAVRRLGAQVRRVEQSVPREAYRALKDRYAALERAHKKLLQHKAAGGHAEGEVMRLREALAKADEAWATAVRDAAEAKAKFAAANTNGAGDAIAPGLGGTPRPQDEVVRLSVELEGERARLQRATRELDLARDARDQLERDLQNAERDLADKVAALQAYHDGEEELRRQMADMVPLAAVAEHQQRVEELEATLREADEGLAATRARADAAEDAVARAEAEGLAVRAEVTHLRQGLRDMAQGSEHALVVARLTEEIVSVRSKEALVRSQLTRSERDRERLLSSVLRLEREVGQRERVADVVGERARALDAALHQASQRLLALQHGGVQAHQARRWALATAEYARRVKWLSEQLDRMRELLLESEGGRLKAESDLEGYKQSHVLAEGSESDARREATRMREQAARLRLERARKEREAAMLRERSSYLDRVNAELEARLQGYEQEQEDDVGRAEREREAAMAQARELQRRLESSAVDLAGVSSRLEEAQAEVRALRAQQGAAAAGGGGGGGRGGAGGLTRVHRDALLEQIERQKQARIENAGLMRKVEALEEELRRKENETLRALTERDRALGALEGAGGLGRLYREPEADAIQGPGRAPGAAAIGEAHLAEIRRLELKAGRLEEDIRRLMQERAQMRDEHHQEIQSLQDQIANLEDGLAAQRTRPAASTHHTQTTPRPHSTPQRPAAHSVAVGQTPRAAPVDAAASPMGRSAAATPRQGQHARDEAFVRDDAAPPASRGHSVAPTPRTATHPGTAARGSAVPSHGEPPIGFEQSSTPESISFGSSSHPGDVVGEVRSAQAAQSQTAPLAMAHAGTGTTPVAHTTQGTMAATPAPREGVVDVTARRTIEDLHVRIENQASAHDVEMAQLQGRLAALQREVEVRRAEAEGYLRELHTARSYSTRHATQTLRSQLAKRDELNRQLRKAFKDLQSKVEKLEEGQRVRDARDADRTATAVEQAQEKSRKLDSQLLRAREDLRDRDAEIAELKSALDTARGRLSAAQRRLDEELAASRKSSPERKSPPRAGRSAAESARRAPGRGARAETAERGVQAVVGDGGPLPVRMVVRVEGMGPLTKKEVALEHWEEGKRLKKKIEGLETKLKQRAKQLEEALSTSSSLSRRIERLEGEHTLLQQQADSAASKVRKAQEAARQRSAGAEQAAEAALAAQAVAETQLRNALAELSHVRKEAELRVPPERHRALLERKRALEREGGDLKEKLASADETVQDLKRRLAEQQSRALQSTSRAELLQQRVTRAQREASGARADTAPLRAELEAAARRAETQQAQIDDLRGKCRALEAQCEQLRSAASRGVPAEVLEGVRRERDEAVAAREAAEAESERVEAELQRAREVEVALKSELDVVPQFIEEITGLQARVRELEEQLGAAGGGEGDA